MTQEQLQNLSRENLDELQLNILAEQARRDTLDTTVGKVKYLGATYESLGGDRARLVEALQTGDE